MPANGKPSGRFELPALAPINFNLTDGTSIPRPPPSPVQEKPPAAPVPAAAPTAASAAAVENERSNTMTSTNGSNYEGRGRTPNYENGPQSPKRPSSIRRFLSRKSMNMGYADSAFGMSSADLNGSRPDSPSSFMDGQPAAKRSRGSSWFKRLGSSNRQAVIYEDSSAGQKTGPPPPKLPELKEFKAKVPENDKGSLGGEDMFNNIK